MACRALDDEEAIRSVEEARAHGGKEGLAALAMYTGFRREEIFQVAWRDLDEEGWIKVMGKGQLAATSPATTRSPRPPATTARPPRASMPP